jgi:hypothetical protein
MKCKEDQRTRFLQDNLRKNKNKQIMFLRHLMKYLMYGSLHQYYDEIMWKNLRNLNQRKF